MKRTFLLSMLFICAALLPCCKAHPTQNISIMTDTLPYAQIPEYPDNYSGANVTARMIDGLGFRYYWATDGLTDADLDYKPSEEGRTAMATLEHLYGLAEVIFNSTKNQPTFRPVPENNMTFSEMRAATLHFLKKASNELKSNPDIKLEEVEVAFKRDERSSSFAYWHLINGPIADAMWHTGQIVSFRRASGNPLDPGVNVFMGTQK